MWLSATNFLFSVHQGLYWCTALPSFNPLPWRWWITPTLPSWLDANLSTLSPQEVFSSTCLDRSELIIRLRLLNSLFLMAGLVGICMIFSFNFQILSFLLIGWTYRIIKILVLTSLACLVIFWCCKKMVIKCPISWRDVGMNEVIFTSRVSGRGNIIGPVCLYVCFRVYSFPPIGGFPPIFHVFLTPPPKISTNLGICRGVCLLKTPKTAQKWPKTVIFSPGNSPLEYTLCLWALWQLNRLTYNLDILHGGWPWPQLKRDWRSKS